MMKLKYKLKNINSYLCVLIAALIGTVTLSVLRYSLSFKRLYAGLIDLIFSVWYYVMEIFNPKGNNVIPTVTQLPDIRLEELIPWDWDELARKFKELFPALFTKDAFLSYVQSIARGTKNASLWLMLLVPVILLVIVLFRRFLESEGKYDHGVDTKPLRLFKKLFRKPFLAVRAWFCGFVEYARGHKLIKVLAWLWVLNLNVMTIVIEFFAFYFYFAASFAVFQIFPQVLKLFVDLVILFGGLPLIAWLVIGGKVFDLWRKKVGYDRLNHNEMKNRGFINSMPVVSMGCGTMGAKKTTLITDMAISTDIMFRDKALELLFKNDMKLPNFPWQKFEDYIKRGIDEGRMYNLASVELQLAVRQYLYEKQGYGLCLWHYDTEFYRDSFDDDLQISDVWDILKTYAKLYFIYIVESSLILSNYSIRTDFVLMDAGNFPLWNAELFRVRPGERPSKYSHIIDFDLFRLGKKVIENSNVSGAFEFGIVDITEIGKERQNTLELKEVKKLEDEANQKNDLFDTELKMIRHAGTVDNYTFVKIFTDEQRASSWGANARELCTVIDILGCTDLTLAMPGFMFGELFYDLFYNKFKAMYYGMRYRRGDNTLFMYLTKNLFELFVRHYVKTYNRFGLIKMKLGTRSGTLEDKMDEHDYYLSIKKIYSARFSTDCYSEFFREKALASKWSLLTAPEYGGGCATVDELEQQNSYFVRDLMKNFGKEKK